MYFVATSAKLSEEKNIIIVGRERNRSFAISKREVCRFRGRYLNLSKLAIQYYNN